MNVSELQHVDPWEWPTDAGRTIAAALRDRDGEPEDRAIAAHLAGDLTVMDDKMAELLLSIAQDVKEPEALRSSASIALGAALEDADSEGYDDDFAEPAVSEKTFTRIKKVLRAIHDDTDAPKELRRRALEASVRAVQDWLKPALVNAYSQSDDEWKLTAAFGMRWVRGFENEISAMLKSRNPEIRCEAIRAAGNWELEEAWPVVSLILQAKTRTKTFYWQLLRPQPTCDQRKLNHY